MSKTVLMLMGRSGSGKSHLENKLIEYRPALFRKVISVTTREPRKGEQHGCEYWFIDRKQFDALDASNQLIQKTVFAEKMYGSTSTEYETKHPFAILVAVPSSVKIFSGVLRNRYPDINIKYVYFDISDSRLRQNMTARGDSEEMQNSRLAADNLHKEFAQTGIMADYVVNDDDLDDTLYMRFLHWLIPSEGQITIQQLGQ